jgi:hypothetical protein
MDDVDQEVVDAGTDTLSFYTTSTPTLNADILRIGDSTNAVGGYSAPNTVATPLIVYESDDSGVGAYPGAEWDHSINVTSSFHFVQAYKDDNVLKVIRINDLHTRDADAGGNDDQALATAIYDGMILFLVQVGADANVLHINSPYYSVSKATSLIQSGATGLSIGANILDDAARQLNAAQRAMIYRFEHDGRQGAFRFITNFES